METVVYGGLVMVDVQYCPTSCPFLGPSGCTVACGKEEIECPVVGRREKDGGGGVKCSVISTVRPYAPLHAPFRKEMPGNIKAL